MPVVKNGSVKVLPHPLWPRLGVKGQIFKFRNNLDIFFFAEILHAGRAAIDMKHIKRDFSLKAWFRAPWVDLGGEAQAKIKLFQNVAYQIKADDAAATW